MTASPQAHVQVIDDDASIRESFRFYLEDLGYFVTEAANGHDGLKRARLLRENREHQQQLEKEVERRTAELTQKMEEMTRFNRMAIGRERRIIELKRLVNSLLGELGRKARFKSPDMIGVAPSLLK